MFVFLFLFALLDHASSQVTIPKISGFNFPSFSSTSCSDGSLTCTGSVTSSDGYLSLTPDQDPVNQTIPRYQVGRVLYKHPVDAWPATIITTFTFRIIPHNLYHVPGSKEDSADGITFIMAPNDSPSPPGSCGSNLGIIDPLQEGTATGQLAVEFDTFKNTFDIDGNHISIDTRSVKYPLTTRSLNSVGVDLKSGKDIQVRIHFQSSTNQLRVFVGYASNTLVQFLDVPINISQIVPTSIYVGFTASTGALTERHQLLNWKLTSVSYKK